MNLAFDLIFLLNVKLKHFRAQKELNK